MEVSPGTVGGFRHRVVIHSTDSRTIDLQVSGFIDPQGPEEKAAMAIEIDGDPDMRVEIGGGILLSLRSRGQQFGPHRQQHPGACFRQAGRQDDRRSASGRRPIKLPWDRHCFQWLQIFRAHDRRRGRGPACPASAPLSISRAGGCHANRAIPD
jgi:hypothetical protein